MYITVQITKNNYYLNTPVAQTTMRASWRSIEFTCFTPFHFDANASDLNTFI